MPIVTTNPRTKPPFKFMSLSETLTKKGARKALFRRVSLVRVDVLAGDSHPVQRTYVPIAAGYGEGARADSVRVKMDRWVERAHRALKTLNQNDAQFVRATLVRLGHLTPGIAE